VRRLRIYGQVLLAPAELQPRRGATAGAGLHHGQLLLAPSRRLRSRRDGLLGAANLRLRGAGEEREPALAGAPAAAQPLDVLPHGGALLLQPGHPPFHAVHAVTKGLVLPGGQGPAGVLVLAGDGQAELPRAALQGLGGHEALGDGASQLELLEEEDLHDDSEREALVLRCVGACLQGELLALHDPAELFLL
jgi:hypothetical protein